MTTPRKRKKILSLYDRIRVGRAIIRNGEIKSVVANHYGISNSSAGRYAAELKDLELKAKITEHDPVPGDLVRNEPVERLERLQETLSLLQRIEKLEHQVEILKRKSNGQHTKYSQDKTNLDARVTELVSMANKFPEETALGMWHKPEIVWAHLIFMIKVSSAVFGDKEFARANTILDDLLGQYATTPIQMDLLDDVNPF